MNLIYYYPTKEGAPSDVARNIFNSLYAKQQELPFKEIIVYTDSKSNGLNGMFKNIKIFSATEIFEINREDLIHLPMSPFVFPNIKFLLHLYARIKSNKIIINYHGDLRQEVKLKYKYEKTIEFSNLPTYLLIPSLLSNTSIVIVNSYLLENLIVNDYGVKSSKVVPNAIENYWFSEDLEPVVKDENLCKIFYHGRLSPEKGVDILIKGFYEFLYENNYPKNVTLYIAGEGSQRECLKRLAQGLNIANQIVFLGKIDKKTIKMYLKMVDGAVYPSIWDNFPLSILEALASANCPVFFSKKAGIYDFVTVDDSLNTFNPDTKNVTDIFQRIFEKKSSINVIENQKKFAEKYTWDEVIDCYIKIYNEAIKS